MFEYFLRLLMEKVLCTLLFLQLLTSNLAAQEIQQSPVVSDTAVARAQFTTEIVDREPVDEIVRLDTDATRVFFFTDLRNMQDQTVTHRWEFEGEVVSEVEFKVGGPRWRVYSAKSLNPGQSGKWTVFVLDESGWPLHASIFMYGKTAE